MNGELLRLIDAIHRDKDIDKEILFDGLEQALLTAAKKKHGTVENLRVRIDRETGEVRAYDGDEKILPIDLGRIAAQTAKQVIIQRIREAEADVVFDEFEKYRHQLVNGQVQRIEGGTTVVNLGRTEGYLPRHEQVRGETYRVGDRIRGFVVEVKKTPQKVKIILSRSHPDLIARLFDLEVPEVAEQIVKIRKLVREAGYKTKVAVESLDPKVDAIGACVGVRGTRIRNIIDEIGGEKIDIIRWNDTLEVLLMNSLKPAQVDSITLFPEEQKALVIVDEDQLSLAIGRKGQNVRLASKLVGWDIDIMTEDEAQNMGVNFDGGETPQVEYIEDKRGDVTSLGQNFRGRPVRSPRRRSETESEDGEEGPVPGAGSPTDPLPLLGDMDEMSPIPLGELDPLNLDAEAAEAELAGAPEAEVPEAEVPDAEVPGAEAPDTEAPETEAPEAEEPEAEDPGIEAAETETPEAESPDAGEEEAVAGEEEADEQMEHHSAKPETVDLGTTFAVEPSESPDDDGELAEETGTETARDEDRTG